MQKRPAKPNGEQKDDRHRKACYKRDSLLFFFRSTSCKTQYSRYRREGVAHNKKRDKKFDELTEIHMGHPYKIIKRIKIPVFTLVEKGLKKPYRS